MIQVAVGHEACRALFDVTDEVARRCGLFRALLEDEMQQQPVPLQGSPDAFALWLQGPPYSMRPDQLLPAIKVCRPERALQQPC